MSFKILTKIILAILLFLCLADMPYGYYQFVRFVSCIVFGYLAYISNEEKLNNQAIVYVVLALLFQPFIKISLGRELWNIVDVIVGVGLILSVINESKESKKN
jgi:hypothetical protein